MLSDSARMLGKYQLIAEIARGGMGVVYLAMVQGPGGFNKLVVIKELKPELVEEPAFLTMFLDEARLAARLSHPNIVQTNEVGHDGDRYFMAMDYLDGRGLDQIRRRSKTAGFGLSVPMQLRVMCDMLAGLDYAHKLSDFDGSPLFIVHRDVSPQNVFVTFDGQVKLLDFGIAKASDSVHETNAGVVKGKASYMSPEQGRGWKVDSRSDVFSAGVMLWEALTGKRLREGVPDPDKMWALVAEDPPLASSIKSWVPPELDRICARAMAWDRENRYSSAAEMQRDLEEYLSSSGTIVSTREVGACISELFREDRVNTNSVIEAHVARARGGVARDNLIPVLDVASRLGAGFPTPTEQKPVAHKPAPRPPTRLTSEDAETGMETSSSEPQPSALSQPRAMPRMQGWKSMVIAGTAGVAVGVGVILVVAQAPDAAVSTVARIAAAQRPAQARTPAPNVAPSAKQASPPASTKQASPPASTTTTAKPVDVKPATITVAIKVAPDTATLAIDGADLARDPRSGQFARTVAADDRPHTVTVSAPGHVAKALPVSFQRDVTLEVKLEPVLPSVPTSTPTTTPASAPTSAPTTAPTTTPPPKLDEPAPATKLPAAPVAQPARGASSLRTGPPRGTVRPAAPRPPRAPPRTEPAPGSEPTREPESASAEPSEPDKPATAPGQTEIDPAGGSKPRRTIEPTNPYGGPQ